MSTTQLFTYLIGGGILVILLIGLVAIIFRRRSPRDGD
jgi:NhaP-type Na+/H+ or K+/H+ antiporter